MRSRRKEACVYEDEPHSKQQETVHVIPARNPGQAVSVDEAISIDPTSTAPSSSESSVGAIDTPASTVRSRATGQPGSETLEVMRIRIKQLEEQLDQTESRSDMVPPAIPDTRIETTATKLSETFHVHRGDPHLDSGVFGQAALVSRSISHKTRLFGQSHWMNSLIPTVGKTGAHATPTLRWWISI